MKLTVWGAAQQVTGSMHLLETNNYTILVDCGLDYEKDTWLEENEQFPFMPSDIDVVILTHAHIDQRRQPIWPNFSCWTRLTSS